MRQRDADGHPVQGALMTTADFVRPAQPKEQYALRTTIEERHRLLKCFYRFEWFSLALI